MNTGIARGQSLAQYNRQEAISLLVRMYAVAVEGMELFCGIYWSKEL